MTDKEKTDILIVKDSQQSLEKLAILKSSQS